MDNDRKLRDALIENVRNLVWAITDGSVKLTKHDFQWQDEEVDLDNFFADLATDGYSIVRTDDHISKTDLTKLADDLEDRTDRDDIDFATGIGVAVDAFRKLAN